MKNYIHFTIPVFILLFSIYSCNDDFLNKKPSDQFTENDLWADIALGEKFVNGIYSSITNPISGQGLKAEFVDEAHDMWFNYFEFNNCFISSDNLEGWRFETWESLYKNIRTCNIFLENIDNVYNDSQELRKRLKGEVLFLRAYFYHQLVSLYGGVPIIEGTYELDDDFSIERSSYEECIEFIVENVDLAVSLLPLQGDKARATKGAALALKSEVLLYAASNLHNNNKLFQNYENPALLGYINGDARDRWIRAREAAKDVIELDVYGLVQPGSFFTDDIINNFVNLFISQRTVEDIFVRDYISLNRANNLARVAGPNGYHLWGQNTPSGTLVDDYQMIDGTDFDWHIPEHAQYPYKNRDPRFYSTVYFEGSYFRPRPPDVHPLDPKGVIQVGSWEVWDDVEEKVKIIPGLDTRDSPIEPYNGGYTGYYLRKFIDTSVDGQFSGQGSPWRFYRYGEILLNYVEACLELGEEQEARDYLNKIRIRAGMPEIISSGIKLIEDYRQERRIELALEDHRFYDVRRWGIASDAYVAFTGVDVLYKLKADKTTDSIPTITPKIVQESSWDNKCYFFPIPRDEINKNPLLTQNPGY